MRENTLRSDLDQFAQEHELLTSRISDLRMWIEEVSQLGTPHFGEMGDRLRPIRAELRDHFTREEVQGCLADAIAAMPELVDDSQGLVIQHTQLLNQFDALIDRLHETAPPFDSWQQACSELDAVLECLSRHEHDELAILEAAAEVECDVGD